MIDLASISTSFCLCRKRQLEARPFPRFGNGRVLHRCMNCGLYQLFPYPVSANTDGTIYSRANYLHKISDDEYYGYFRALYDYALSPLLTPKSRVLDFGAGSCHYHKFLRDLGHLEVYSLEINPHLASVAKSYFGLTNVVTTFDDLPMEPFDLVYANQVLEHIFDPVELLHGPIAQRLKPEGYVVFSVPNSDSLNRSMLGRRWIGYSEEEHIWFFSARSVRRLFAASRVYTVEKTIIKSALNTQYDRFRPRSAVKRAYYQTLMRVFEFAGRGDQLIVVLRKRSTAA